MPCCGSLWVHLVWVCLYSCTWIPVSFFMFSKFLAIILSNMLCIPFSIFCLSGIPITLVLVCIRLSVRSLKLFSFLKVCFSFCFSDWVISINLPSRLLTHSLVSPNLNIWIWVISGSWWWTGRPGVLQFMGSQSRTRLSDWTELIESQYVNSLQCIFF